MVTTTMIQYMFTVLLISGLNSHSASSLQIGAKTNNNDKYGGMGVQQKSRKLADNVEIITYSNLINDDIVDSSALKVAKSKNDVNALLDGDAKEYQYFNDASAVSTPKYELSNYDMTKYESPKYESLQYDATKYDPPANYEPSNYEAPKYGPPLPPLPPSIEIPSNYKIDESDLTHSYYTQQFEPMSYAPSDTFTDGKRPIHVIPSSAHELSPISPATSIAPIHPGPGHIVRVTHSGPIWAPEMQKLETQYLETYRSIKSSVLSFYYKMQYVVNYFMSLFTLAGELNILLIYSLCRILGISRSITKEEIDQSHSP